MYSEANGLTHKEVMALAFDREGNLWLGTAGAGAMQLSNNGFVTYTEADHLTFPSSAQPTLFRDRKGEVGVALRHVLNVLRGGKFVEMVPQLPAGIQNLGWGWHQTVVQTHIGEWWMATGQGLLRYPNVAVEALPTTRPKAVYTTRDGLRTSEIFRVFEDSRGDVWIGCIGPAGQNGLSRWRRDTDSFDHFTVHPEGVPSAFADDQRGSVWIGYWDGALARFRSGSLEYYGTKDGLAGGSIYAVHIDHAGRLWVASTRGLTRADDAGRDMPRFVTYGVEQGLASNVILCITEDAYGRVYLATGRGIDRIGPAGRITPGSVTHYNASDGLTRGDLRDVLVDGTGTLWCASEQGISRFTPGVEHRSVAPPVFIRGVKVRGVPYRSWDTGQVAVPNLKLSPDQNQLEINFAGLSFDPGQTTRYEYRLDGVDRDWSEPTEQRSVTFSRVAPGRYRFSVRLVTDEGLMSAPAVLDFVVLAPIQQRLWFRSLLAVLAGLLLYGLHRYRMHRVLELERVRTRIATDLHDEIGSGLSQIAILSEVARTRANGDASVTEMLRSIGSVSRELAASMSDIVWTVNARRDQVSDVIQRMRRFSSDVLTGNNIEVRFQAPAAEFSRHISIEVRREVYLMFKEAINNAIRHSGCTRVDVGVSVDDHRLELIVEDNGRGLSEPVNGNGTGLASMQERALRVHGTIVFSRGSLGGLQVTARIPLRRGAVRVQRATSSSS